MLQTISWQSRPILWGLYNNDVTLCDRALDNHLEKVDLMVSVLTANTSGHCVYQTCGSPSKGSLLFGEFVYYLTCRWF